MSTINPANRLAWDYRTKARELGPPPGAGSDGIGILDPHIHVNGARAARIYKDAATLFGVGRIYSQTRIDQADAVRGVLGDDVRFIATPNFSSPDRARAFADGFLEQIQLWHDRYGSRMIKLWNAPRLRELLPPEAQPEIVQLDGKWRVEAAKLAEQLGMMIMTHTADPDTWFATKYSDAARFGTKRSQYRGLEVMLDRFTCPWILAHMGGSPEDLDFLDGLLTRHPNAYLDTSATKWIVRELSKHEDTRMLDFFQKWRTRIFFGSDIVTTDDHVTPKSQRGGATVSSPFSDLAETPEAAFDLYASRYWALRTMFETRFDAPSPIADPDLMMVEPDKYDAMSAPRLRGRELPKDLLIDLYQTNTRRVIDAWWDAHP